MDETSRLLTVKETCKYLRISAPTLYRMLERNELITVKIGKRTLFDKKDLDAYIDSSKGPTSRKPSAAGRRRKKVETTTDVRTDRTVAPEPESKSEAETKAETESLTRSALRPERKPKEKHTPKPEPDRLF
ncbi:MAG: helix-turn-helix domain-containing protein [candidate division WOR-3 bacterium]